MSLFTSLYVCKESANDNHKCILSANNNSNDKLKINEMNKTNSIKYN